MAQFVEDSEIEAGLVDLIKTPLAQIKDYTPRQVKDANTWAYNEIITALTTRGYTLDQIETWDRAAEFEKSQALWWLSFFQSGWFKDVESELLKYLDRREELKTIGLTEDGVPIDPEPGDEETGPVGHGAMYTGYEVFRRPQRKSPWPVRVTGN
jgi:hypothetical protein